MNAINNVEVQNQAVGLKYESFIGGLLRRLDPSLEDLKSTMNTDLQYVSDFRLDDEHGQPRQLIEVKSCRWFSSTGDYKSVLLRMMKESLEKSEKSGRPQGLLHQYLRSVHAVDNDESDNYSLVIIGLYDVSGDEHASQMLSDFEFVQDRALENYRHYILLWSFPKHETGYSAIASRPVFESLVQSEGLCGALKALGEVIQTNPFKDSQATYQPYYDLLPEPNRQYCADYAASLIRPNKGATYNKKPWYVNEPVKVFELPAPEQVSANEDEELVADEPQVEIQSDGLPKKIPGVDLVDQDFADIRDGILAGYSLKEVCHLIDKSHAYIHGVLRRTHPKYDEFKKWISDLQDSVKDEGSIMADQTDDSELSKVIQRQNLVLLDRQTELDELNLQNEILLKAREEQATEIVRLTSCVNDLSFRLGESKKIIKNLESELEDCKSEPSEQTSSSSAVEDRLKHLERVLLKMFIETTDKHALLDMFMERFMLDDVHFSAEASIE
jgi:hypothetical protein